MKQIRGKEKFREYFTRGTLYSLMLLFRKANNFSAHSALEFCSWNQHIMSTARALQTKVHACADDLPGVRAAGMGLLHLDDVAELVAYFFFVHRLTR